jgi:hypothetical protein
MSTITDVELPGIDRRALLKAAVALLVARPEASAFAELAAPPAQEPQPDAPSNFRAIYGDPTLRARFYPFLQNVFHLYPEESIHRLITDLAAAGKTDEEIYRALLAALPTIKPTLSEIRYGVPALRKQKDEMTRQALAFLGAGARVNGYLEIGTTGRYVSDLRHHVAIAGPIWIVNDVAPSYAPADILERAEIAKIGSYVPMGNYDAFAGVAIPEASLDLVVNFIGFHHAPDDRLEGFVQSVRRVLRPGGRLLLRDHDVDGSAMSSLVALAHDVFNAGLFLSWDENHRQVRRFRSLSTWTEYLTAAGFRRSERAIAQDGDPTRNLLVELVRV